LGISTKTAKIRNEKESAFGYLVTGNLALKGAFMTSQFKTAFGAVLGGSALYTGTPHSP